MSREITVPATDISNIRNQPARQGDTEVTVRVMRSCVFLNIRRGGKVTAHVDISPENWRKLASAPAPIDTEQEDARHE